MDTQYVLNRMYRWAELVGQSNNVHVSPSTIKVKVDDDGIFHWARFVAIIKIDIQKSVQTRDIPHWAVQQGEYDLHDSILYFPPVQMDVRDIGAFSAVVKPNNPIILKRFYDIGVPFELAESKTNPDRAKPTFGELAASVIKETEISAYQYLDKNGYQEAPISRLEIITWDDFPKLNGYYD